MSTNSTSCHRGTSFRLHKGLVFLAGAAAACGLVAGAGSAAAEEIEIVYDWNPNCYVNVEFRVGPAFAGASQGPCSMPVGTYFADDGILASPGGWYLGGVTLPNGVHYTGWVENSFGASEMDIPFPRF